MIPTSFKLGGNTWKVRLYKHLVQIGPNNDVQHLYGLCDVESNMIKIARAIDGRVCSEETIYKTFIHEFLHAALYTCGKAYQDEELVIGLENMVWQYLRTARGGQAAAVANGVQLDNDSPKRARTKRASGSKAQSANRRVSPTNKATRKRR